MSKTPAYKIRSLVHAYGRKTVLDIPELDIPAGKVYGLVGPNSSGKTTLLSILGLLQSPLSGKIFLNGTETGGAGDRRRLGREVTLVHQKPVLFSTTVQNNVSYGLRAAGLPPNEVNARVQAALRDWGLQQYGQRDARKLSGGEAQRIVLARCLILETPVVLLDEPTHSLDDTFRPLLVEALAKANRTRSTTIIVASHDFAFLSSLTDQIIRMEAGRIAGAS
jgi:tungstate transport system ATP-binding protein